LRAYLKGRLVTVRGGDTGVVSEVETLERIALQPGDTVLVPTGLKARVPRGYEAQVRIRSSIAFARGLILPNAPGTVDSDYPDEWLVMVKNGSSRPAQIEHGERIAQAVINKVEVMQWAKGKVGISTDRKGGLGSTGVGSARDQEG
jgi:dUTP pyrophosphatase